MIAKTSPSVSYSIWLKRILDVHAAQSWDAESTEVLEREEDELNDLWTEIDDQQKERLWGLSSDLHTLHDRETWVESDWPSMTKQDQQHYYHEALRTVDGGFARLGPSDCELASVLAGAYATKSLCLAHMDRPDESLRVLDEAVQRFPENTTLLIARGLLKQELGRPDGVEDLRGAVNRGTTVVWPYLGLARHALQEGRNDQAAELCRSGLALAQRDTVAAMLFELLAITLLRLNDSKDVVRTAFQNAADLDPLREDVRINLERFESYMADPEAKEPQWELNLPPGEIAIDDVYAQLQPAA
jgi:tetratricopeptide (TPR) repeat protein